MLSGAAGAADLVEVVTPRTAPEDDEYSGGAGADPLTAHGPAGFEVLQITPNPEFPRRTGAKWTLVSEIDGVTSGLGFWDWCSA